MTRKLYGAVLELSEDVLHRYPLFYLTVNPKSTSDVLIGSTDSWTGRSLCVCSVVCCVVCRGVLGCGVWSCLADVAASALVHTRTVPLSLLCPHRWGAVVHQAGSFVPPPDAPLVSYLSSSSC